MTVGALDAAGALNAADALNALDALDALNASGNKTAAKLNRRAFVVRVHSIDQAYEVLFQICFSDEPDPADLESRQLARAHQLHDHALRNFKLSRDLVSAQELTAIPN
jgi:hypothetical protein